ncbi:hypothetical protein JTE90_022070 [Oedothorax gibbosus]|uniref:Reverse transcriptase domain-containing protein n=1 Tax=Oedothorax gibbosus TaxID=931172 RepID=A0AAV6TWG6_9ARAC|nr:hypothetical protein JTE90_022070 [Oedothorax gibbosus]
MLNTGVEPVHLNKGMRLDLPGCDTLLHRINLTTEHQIRQHPYRVPQQLKPELNTHVNELLESGIVQESESPNLAPVLLVRKRDGTYRLCTDLRRINEHTVPLPYPISNITELVDNLGGSRLFSTLDLCSGFFQMKLHPDDMWKTAFSTKTGLYEWTRAPMGMRNAPNSFQRLMEIVLPGLSPLGIAPYFDDIIVASSDSVDEHFSKLELVKTETREMRVS